MLKRLSLIFKASWLCKTVTSLFVGLNAIKTLGHYIIKELEGSEAGDKVVPIINRFISLSEAALDSLSVASTFVCGSTIQEQPAALSTDAAIEALDRATAELKKQKP